jgi:hypothetical protein
MAGAHTNKINLHKSRTAWNFTSEMFTLTQTGTKTIKLLKTSTTKHQNNYYKCCFTVELPLIRETAGLFLKSKKARFVLL